MQLGQHTSVLRCIGQHPHVFVVFCSAAHHRWATNVDVFNRVFQRAARLGNRGLKRVQINYKQVNCVNVVCCQCRHVLRHIASGQQAAVYFGVQGFNPTIEHFRKSSVVCHLGHGQARVCQQFGSTAR